jgi:hypothetical protein
VRGAARVLAAAHHVKAERAVIGDAAFEVMHRDDDVVELQGHGCFLCGLSVGCLWVV